jgi:hypothetical protein
MSTTVSNSNPITITGGTMALGARATIYPNQIKRSFKVMKVEFTSVAGNTVFAIQDNSTGANVLLQGIGTIANSTSLYDFGTGVEWADWKVTTLSAADTLSVFIK